jgi:NAD+ synthase (glutamine-hydrolysing)
LIFDGHSVALDTGGDVIALGKGFEEEVLMADLSPEARSQKPEVRSEFPSREQQIFSALSLGVRDYVRKCGFKSVILGLSGGIDSALVAVMAADALGAENVLGVLDAGALFEHGQPDDAEALAKNLGIRYEVCRLSRRFWPWRNNWKKFLPAPSRTRPRKISSRGCAA